MRTRARSNSWTICRRRSPGRSGASSCARRSWTHRADPPHRRVRLGSESPERGCHHRSVQRVRTPGGAAPGRGGGVRTAHGAFARMAQPVSRALLPQWAARALGLAALASVGALEWQRLIGGYSSARALLWVLAALLAAGLALAAGRSPAGLRRAAALAGALALALLAGYVLSGVSLSYLRPRRWDDLVSGLVSGAQALGTVRLPYVSVDPWPAITLQVLGA